MKLLREYPERVFMGVPCHGGGRVIYLRRPTWDCDVWGWQFGVLLNRRSYYHLNTLPEQGNLYDQLVKHFPADVQGPADEGRLGAVNEMVKRGTLWTFCEVVKMTYALIDAADVLWRGGAHYAKNPCADLIKSPRETRRINEILIPHLIDAMYVALGVVEPLPQEAV